MKAEKLQLTWYTKSAVNEFAFLQVKAIETAGAFMDWGLDKDLLVPFREQRQRMEKGRWYVWYICMLMIKRADWWGPIKSNKGFKMNI